MTILGIETSCDETAVSIIRGRGGCRRPNITVLAHVVSSQVAVHAPWGGVVPMLAKREHGRNLLTVTEKALAQARLLKLVKKNLAEPIKNLGRIKKILAREPELSSRFIEFLPTIKRPPIDAIAVTTGPGLEPALWAGLNFARALAETWNKPLLPINHMEGHIVSALANAPLAFPVIALLVSGGHTELVLMKNWFKYQIVGQTRDDAVGEAFDKVARLLGLPYPGGPALAKLATSRQSSLKKFTPPLPRPMLDSPDFDFSFSGLKTAVLYRLRDRSAADRLDEAARADLAADFQQAVIDVLLKKTVRAIEHYQPQTVIVAGGVIANQELRQQLTKALVSLPHAPQLLFPPLNLATDNATMIAMAGYFRAAAGKLSTRFKRPSRLRANGRLILK
ncbi:MAG: tRNA (adenosine(37)-N6)-threonylcarbamoyltransferase complex transferase subunit TsaD [Patescibacteria group bacterium]